MITDPPSHLVDRADGSILLRLVPFYLARLHTRDLRGDMEYARFGLPFPFLSGAAPIDLVLQSGMTPATIGEYGGGFEPNSSLGNTSWWRWASYALTPFGWVPFPTPFFTDGKLTSLTLIRHGGTPAESFDAINKRMRVELGEPSTASDRSCDWRFGWGEVGLYFEPRDGEAQLGVSWGAPRVPR